MFQIIEKDNNLIIKYKEDKEIIIKPNLDLFHYYNVLNLIHKQYNIKKIYIPLKIKSKDWNYLKYENMGHSPDAIIIAALMSVNIGPEENLDKKKIMQIYDKYKSKFPESKITMSIFKEASVLWLLMEN
ncbi:hypothetical protein PV326_003172 [Microctonus aethiopoides]|nr:hypothetical protein PV326_003172 [Microctonus aethiopoides]